MTSCISINVAGLTIALIDMAINFIGIFLSCAVLLYQACTKINCHIPVTETIVKELHRKYSKSSQSTLQYESGRNENVEINAKELSETIDAEFWPLLLFIILCFAQIIFNGMLIHGIRNSDIHKVKVYLIFKACIVIVGIFLVLTQDSIGQGVYRQISEILYVFLTLFFMCIIFILYDTMHRHRQQHINRSRSSSGRLIQN